MSHDLRRYTTPRLRLEAPTPDDLDALHRIYADERLWQHFPSQRHLGVTTTEELLESWLAAWEQDGLGPWLVRAAGGDGTVLGTCGCQLRGGVFWNLAYRFTVEAHGHGYATESGREALRAARDVNPSLPVVAYLVEHNTSSAKVAQRLGLQLQHRGPDAGNLDPAVVRVVYADRNLSAQQLAAATAREGKNIA